MAEAMDVSPLPAAEVGPGALEQGQGGGDVVLPPLLVGHLHGPPVLEPLELLPLPLGLGPGLRLAVAGRRRPLGLGLRWRRLGRLLAASRARSAARHCQTAAPPSPPSSTASSPSVYAAARVGFRRAHLASRSTAPAARTLTGSPAANRPQVGRQRRRRRVALGRVLLQALQADQLQVARQALAPASPAARARPPSPSAAVAIWSGAVERAGPGQALVEDRAQGVDVGLRADELGRRPGPARGPCTPACPSRACVAVRSLAAGSLGQAEVGDLGLAAVRRTGRWRASGRGGRCPGRGPPGPRRRASPPAPPRPSGRAGQSAPSRSVRLPPGRYSMARKGRPSASPYS